MIFAKGEQTLISFGGFFQETKEKLENVSLTFSSWNHFYSSDPQPSTVTAEAIVSDHLGNWEKWSQLELVAYENGLS